jgi:hypothetical protein
MHHVEDAVNRALDGVKSYYDLHRRIHGISRLVSSNSKIIEFHNADQDILSGMKLIHNYDEWRKFEFSCVQIVGGDDKFYRFKSVPQLSMYGDRIDRIYYTNKYPFSEDYRYRVLKDKIDAEAKSVIILFGDISKVFTEYDKTTFVNVQSLPKLTLQDLAAFKKIIDVPTKSESRVTKEEVSFLKVSRNSSRARDFFSQQSADKIPDMLTEFPVYWVGSNKRYEFKLGDNIFHLKVQNDKTYLVCQYFDFFLDYIEPNITFKPSQFGVAVLPQGHPLRGMLPELEYALVEGVRFVAMDFMNKTFYKVENSNHDVLLNRLLKNPELLMKIIAGAEGEEFQIFLSDWVSAGMPQPVQKIEQPSLPFQILPEDERDLLRDDYYSKRNIKELNVQHLYEYIGNHGFPLIKSFLWCGVRDNDIADDLLDYVANKAGRLFKDGN